MVNHITPASGNPFDSDRTRTALALLVLAFAGLNVSVQGGAGLGKPDREEIAAMLTEGGVLTADTATLRIAARAMLTTVLSCRDNMTDSGPVARIAGDTVGAAQFLPTMATEEFLSCLSKTAIERAAAAEEVRVEARGKDTRAQLVARFKDSTYVYPAALFKLTDADLAEAARRAPYRFVPGSAEVTDDTNSTSEGDGAALSGGSVPEPESDEGDEGAVALNSGVLAEAAD